MGDDVGVKRRAVAALIAAAALAAACSDTSSSPSTSGATTTSTVTTTTQPATTTTDASTTSTSTSTTTTSTSTTTTVAPTVPPTVAPPTTRPPSTTSPTTAPPSGTRSIAVHRLPTSSKVVALTLDAGSDVGYTDLILDTLAAKGVAASFGVTGEFAAAHPDQVRRMAREGHVVMNHTYRHYSYTGVSSTRVFLSAADRQADLDRADAVLAPLIGRTTKPFWRPPYGDYNTSVLDDVGAIGYRYTVMWTFDSLGWKGLTVDQIVARVFERIEPGAIVVMHVGSQSQDGPALARIIDGLRDRGYSFTTIAAAFG